MCWQEQQQPLTQRHHNGAAEGLEALTVLQLLPAEAQSSGKLEER
jgi:hypothetical protein